MNQLTFIENSKITIDQGNDNFVTIEPEQITSELFDIIYDLTLYQNLIILRLMIQEASFNDDEVVISMTTWDGIICCREVFIVNRDHSYRSVGREYL